METPKVRLLVTSFNMGNKAAEGLEHLLPPAGEGYDLLAMGFQESTYSPAKESSSRAPASTSAGGKVPGGNREVCVAQLLANIQSILGSAFELVSSNKRAQMQLIIFARSSIRSHITNVELSAENTGFLHVFPNKGGLCISLMVHGTSLSFISCHLAAHEGVKKCFLRNESCKEILGGVRAGDKRFDPSLLTHHTFWMGDMNYRTTFDKTTPADLDASARQHPVAESSASGSSSGPTTPTKRSNGSSPSTPSAALADNEDAEENEEPEEETNVNRAVRQEQFNRIFDMIEKENWGQLMTFDELNRELLAGRVLNGFQALQPTFPPTFKRIRGTSIVRQPSVRNNSRKEFALFLSSDPTSPPEHRLDTFYTEQRLPSYTDRVLYKSLPGFLTNLDVLGFESCEGVTSSDHKPVRASFAVRPTMGVNGIYLTEDPTGIAFKIFISDLKGFDLAEMDSATFGGGSDPYVVALTDPDNLVVKESSKVKSSTIKHNLNPDWGKERLILNLRSDHLDGLAENSHLFLSVWDYDRANSDDLIGVVSFSFKQLLNSLQTSAEFLFDSPIYSNGLHQGRLSGRITAEGFRPHSDQAGGGIGRVQTLANVNEVSSGCACAIA